MYLRNLYFVLPLLALAGCFANLCKDSGNTLENAHREIEKLKRENEALKSQKRGLRHPSWAELRAFIEQDKGDTKTFIETEYNCEDFSLALRDAARERGFHAAYVSLDYKKETIGHAINAFNTSDHGLIYIEPQSDSIAYIKKGKRFGSIPIESVKRPYLVCPKTPSDLTKKIQSTRYEGKLFEYGYYEHFTARVSCYEAAVDAYNAAAKNYNNGSSRFTEKQIDTWSENLELLEDDLFKQPYGYGTSVVDNIKAHW